MAVRFYVARLLLSVSGRLLGEAPPPSLPHRGRLVYVLALNMLALWVLLGALLVVPGPSHSLARLI